MWPNIHINCYFHTSYQIILNYQIIQMEIWPKCNLNFELFQSSHLLVNAINLKHWQCERSHVVWPIIETSMHQDVIENEHTERWRERMGDWEREWGEWKYTCSYSFQSFSHGTGCQDTQITDHIKFFQLSWHLTVNYHERLVNWMCVYVRAHLSDAFQLLLQS